MAMKSLHSKEATDVLEDVVKYLQSLDGGRDTVRKQIARAAGDIIRVSSHYKACKHLQEIYDCKTPEELVGEINKRMTAMTKFIQIALVDVSWEGCDFYGSDIQDELGCLGIIEERPVNPDENEFGASTLFFIKDEYKVPPARTEHKEEKE